jgi:Zn finger protein HypA/HybF involved in hydrogenase expression
MEGRVRALPPPLPGPVRCLRCGGPFDSPDRRRVRICPHCKSREPKTYGVREVAVSRVYAAIRGR